MAIYIVGWVVLYAVVVAVVYFIGGAGTATILGLIFAIWFAVEIQNEYRSMKNIERVELINRTDIYKSGLGATGFSLGLDGKPRILLGSQTNYERTDVTFFVYYTDKQPQKITVKEGSKKYQKLLSYVGREAAKQESLPQISAPAPQITTAPAPKIAENPQEKRYYVDVPFEVLSNEFSLNISFQSCQMIETEEKKKAEVRFEASYDPKVKGVRSQRVVCAVVDSKNRIVSVMRDVRNLDGSGRKLVDITFWQNIEETPTRVRVGLERYS